MRGGKHTDEYYDQYYDHDGDKKGGIEGCPAPFRVVPNLMGVNAINCAECLSTLYGRHSCKDECGALPRVRTVGAPTEGRQRSPAPVARNMLTHSSPAPHLHTQGSEFFVPPRFRDLVTECGAGRTCYTGPSSEGDCQCCGENLGTFVTTVSTHTYMRLNFLSQHKAASVYRYVCSLTVSSSFLYPHSPPGMNYSMPPAMQSSAGIPDPLFKKWGKLANFKRTCDYPPSANDCGTCLLWRKIRGEYFQGAQRSLQCTQGDRCYQTKDKKHTFLGTFPTDPGHYLVMPGSKTVDWPVIGIEDRQVLTSKLENIWDLAWRLAYKPYQQLPFVSFGSVRDLPVSDTSCNIGIGLNPASARSQHQMHIHIARIPTTLRRLFVGRKDNFATWTKVRIPITRKPDEDDWPIAYVRYFSLTDDHKEDYDGGAFGGNGRGYGNDANGGAFGGNGRGYGDNGDASGDAFGREHNYNNNNGDAFGSSNNNNNDGYSNNHHHDYNGNGQQQAGPSKYGIFHQAFSFANFDFLYLQAWGILIIPDEEPIDLRKKDANLPRGFYLVLSTNNKLGSWNPFRGSSKNENEYYEPELLLCTSWSAGDGGFWSKEECYGEAKKAMRYAAEAGASHRFEHFLMNQQLVLEGKHSS